MDFLGVDDPKNTKEAAGTWVFPCPYEKTTSYLKGTVKGPEAILAASHQVEWFDAETASTAAEEGIYTFPAFDYSTPGGPDEWLGKTQAAMEPGFRQGKFVVTLGGEHTISSAPVRAAVQAYGAENLSILHFDAHSDMRNAYEGDPYSHASVMRRIHELVPRTYSVGIRAQCEEEYEYIKQSPSVGVLYDHVRAKEGIHLATALEYLPTEKIYVTIDLDYFTPKEMPSVGTPVPGGGEWYETLHFLREVFQNRQVVGCDVVELKPDTEVRSDFLAAQLVYKLMTYRWRNS